MVRLDFAPLVQRWLEERMAQVEAEQGLDLAGPQVFRPSGRLKPVAFGTFAIADSAPGQEPRARQMREVHPKRAAFCTNRVAVCRTGSVGTRSVSKRTYTPGVVRATFPWKSCDKTAARV